MGPVVLHVYQISAADVGPVQRRRQEDYWYGGPATASTRVVRMSAGDADAGAARTTGEGE
jgi:hypothetical protein